MKWHRIVLIGVSLLFASHSFSAIPNKMEDMKGTLQKPLSYRADGIRKQGKISYKLLRDIAFDKKESVSNRWKALMTLAYMGKKESVLELETAAQSADWFMREGALVGMTYVAPKQATVWARRLMADPALVVRTQAVKTLQVLKDTGSQALLWEKLYSPQNFRGKQSLWVRRHIVEALSQFSQKGDEVKFIKLLEDTDTSLHEPAIKALEKITGEKSTGKSVIEKKESWKKWWDSTRV